MIIFTGSITRSTTRRYLSYSKADFKFFFAPHRRRVALMGEKFGKEEGTDLRAKFHPHPCNDKGIGPPKTEMFTEI